MKTSFVSTNVYTVSTESNAIIDITNKYTKDKKEEKEEKEENTPENKQDTYEYHIVTTSTH